MDAFFGLDTCAEFAIGDAVTLPEGADYRHELSVVTRHERERGCACGQASTSLLRPIAFVRWGSRSIADPPCKVAPAIASMHDARIMRPDRCGEIDAWSRADLHDAIRTVGTTQ